MYREQPAGLALLPPLAAKRPRHRRGVQDVEVGTAEIDAGDAVDRHADQPVDGAVRREADQPAAIHFGTPKKALGIDRGPVRVAAQAGLGKAREHLAAEHGASGGVVAVSEDAAGPAVGEKERATVEGGKRALADDKTPLALGHGQNRVEAG